MINKAAVLASALWVFTAAAATAGETAPETRTIEAPFEDVLLELQDNVIGRGLVIDYTGHVDKMLERTAEAAGSVTSEGSPSPYLNAKYIQFCSARLTHEAVSASPRNLAICPYLVYVYETRTDPGTVQIGYRKPVFGPSKASRKVEASVNAFLQEIVDQVAEAPY